MESVCSIQEIIMGQTTAATADKYGRGSGTQNPQLSGKEKHVKKPSKFPPERYSIPSTEVMLVGRIPVAANLLHQLISSKAYILPCWNRLKGLLIRMEKCENWMESVEKTFDSCSISSCSTPSRKRIVPEVRIKSE